MNILKQFCNWLPLGVAAGPFRGTRCKLTSTGDGVVAKLAGTYEMEIYPAFEAAIRHHPAVVVDIGAAEGFYVAGLARALPAARVVAYEAKKEWWARIEQLMSLNGVASRCEIRGFCDREEFARMLAATKGAQVFILMDIEGGEFELLDQDTLPLLGHAELLVELHEPESRAMGDDLAVKLGETHRVDLIWAKETRTALDVPAVGWRLTAQALPAVRQRLDEGRAYHMRWLHAVPKTPTA
jgi:hypothetical protein